MSEIALMIWSATSLGFPFIAFGYVNMLGECINVKALGESGIVQKITENKNQEEPNEEKNCCFFDDVRFANMIFPFFVFLGPFSIPISILFMLKASVDVVGCKLDIF
jgi:hypothetical protein